MTRITSSISFYCRSSKTDRNGYAPIELSIIINGKRTFVKLPRKEIPAHFKQQITSKRDNDIKQYLDQIRTQYNNYQTELLRNNLPITPQTLKECLKNGGIPTYTIETLFEEFLALQRKRIGKNLTEPAYNKYEYVRNIFYRHIDKKKEVTAITCSVIESFYIALQQKYNTATSASYMTRLKTIITYALNDGRLKINPFKNIKVKRYTKKIEFLTEEELQRINNLVIDNKSLADIRDAFIFQASSGLSYIDLLNLKPADIKIDPATDTHYITKTRHKTNTEYTTVILPMGVEILKKHNYNLHIITCQKYNLLLKTIQVLADIPKTLTTHIARKTFCCLLLNRGVNINTVAKCAGHSDIKITRSYYATLQESTVIKEVTAIF